MARALALLGLLALAGSALSAYCSGKPDPNAQQNMNPIMTDPPVFVRGIKNAQLYTVGSGDDMLNIVHLWGSPYEMGYAHGTLMTKEATGLVNGVWSYLEAQVEQAINGSVHNLKPWFVDLISEVGLDAALDLTTDATEAYTGKWFTDEMHGLADATGLDYKKIRRIHMLGELTQGDCSMYGAWGDATRSSNSTLFQLRALDWDVDGPFRDFPQITVYHTATNGSNGYPFANIGWTGWLGSITGISSQQMAISEIGVSFPDNTFGKESRIGMPFTYLLRNILQFTASVPEAEKYITDAKRTCNLILGVGDGKPNGSFIGIQYSASVANYFNDQNNMPIADWHPRIDNIVYYGMDWLCPNYSEVLAAQLQKNYGNINAETTIQDITAIAQTGDLLIAIYDLANMVLHTANARRDGASGPEMAYDRSFIRIDMKQVFAVTQQ